MTKEPDVAVLAGKGVKFQVEEPGEYEVYFDGVTVQVYDSEGRPQDALLEVACPEPKPSPDSVSGVRVEGQRWTIYVCPECGARPPFNVPGNVCIAHPPGHRPALVPVEVVAASSLLTEALVEAADEMAEMRSSGVHAQEATLRRWEAVLRASLGERQDEERATRDQLERAVAHLLDGMTAIAASKDWQEARWHANDRMNRLWSIVGRKSKNRIDRTRERGGSGGR